ncbi:MAG: PIN domain-containing protein [Bacteroides sp.]|nr:PIN domain-containing protein [Bacteroides sp.]
MMKVFLDTNIVIDLLDKRAPFYVDAVKLFTLAYQKKITLFVSPMTYATASYLLRKHGKEGMRKLLSNFRQLSRITTADESVVDAALASSFDDYEDALQYYSALTGNVDVIVTRNKKDFVLSRIPVLLPEELLAQL